MRIRTFILSASAIVALGFVGISYFAISRVLEYTVRENAQRSSATLAEVTFASMYQLMSTGWSRNQATNFLGAVRSAARNTPTNVEIYRGDVVVRDYGEIEQPPFDDALRGVLTSGRPVTQSGDSAVRYLRPLVADERCLGCHAHAVKGSVLGAIEVRQDFAPLVETARQDFIFWLSVIAPLAVAMALIVAWRVNRRLEQSIKVVDDAVSQIGAVSDLRKLQFSDHELGFDELNRLFGHLGELVEKLRVVAVDKDVLRFEIGLLEKFVISSEIVSDWGDYVMRLLTEINRVTFTPFLFSLFQVGDDSYDLDVFWARPPDDATRSLMEVYVHELMAGDPSFDADLAMQIRHHAPAEGVPLTLDAHAVRLQTRALMVEQPKIGGIVGIGVHSPKTDDDAMLLVVNSILSTMLNVVGSVRAIHKYTRDMEYYATRDPLTDLYNRRVFWELFEYEVARAGRHEYRFALLVVDLDNFKLVNDAYGHGVGDHYLQAVAQAMKRVLRPGDIFARYGGDEFVALLPEVTIDTAAVVAQRVLEAAASLEVAAPDGAKVAGSVSIGLAVYPLHADNARDLFLFADNMMYKAKNAGKHQIGVPDEQELAAVFKDMTQTTMMVVAAVNEGRIVPFFQPILDLHGDGRVIGYEVLSRLQHDGQFMEAHRFIEFAEKAGVIHRLDTMVMETALRTVAVSGFEGHVFINLSPRALTLTDFLQTLRTTVAAAGMRPDQVVFEITERDTIKNIAVLERLVSELKHDGFKLAIDDFGSGFSSFQYLRRFPVDFVKIEGDFVVNILENRRDRAFIQTIRQLASDLGIQVIAEHVESREVLEELRHMGIELAQGHYVGRPARELGGGTSITEVS